MKKKIPSFLLLLILFCISLIPALSVQAASETIRKSEIQIELSTDGSAWITQTFDIENLSSGTEYYYSIPGGNHLAISSLEVHDETERTFETLNNWDTDRSLEEKAYTCGILETDDGYELCWGIGSYGSHFYTIQYRLGGLVQSYEDYAGFYYQFYSSELVSSMEDVEITVYMNNTPLTTENSRAWPIAFSGYLEFTSEGTIYTYNEDDLKSNQNIRLLCRFDLDMFPDASKITGTFENVQEEALQVKKESDLDSDLIFITVIGSLLAIVLIIVLINFIDSKMKLSDGTRQKRPQWKKIEPRSTLPFEGNIPAAYYSLKQVRHSMAGGQAFGAYLIKWENDGCLHMKDKNNSKQAKDVVLSKLEQPHYSGCELKLYNMIRGLLDSQGVIAQKNLQTWVEKHYDKIIKWEKELQKEGQTWMEQNGYRQADEKGKMRFTPRGYEHLVQLQGLHHYLKKYDQHYNSGEIHTELWGDYLIYALLLGINEQLIVSLKQSDPYYFDEFSHHYGYDPHTMTMLFIMTNRVSHKTISHAQMTASAGTGGSMSIGGGGGFSGGGGGGSR